MSIKVLLADDHNILIHGLIKAIQLETDIVVVGKATDGLTAIQLVKELEPDIVLMDIAMPELNGIEATRHIAKQYPKTKVIALSMHSSKRYIHEMFRAGAYGYILKNCGFEELTKAIKTVYNKQRYISPSITEAVVDNYITNSNTNLKSVFTTLTIRERQVLQLMTEGKTTKQIGRKLFISPKTVEAHRLRVMHKLNMDSVAQLTKYAIQEGLTMPEP